MEIGVHTPPLYDRSPSEALDYLADIGVSAVEPGVGCHPGSEHLPPEEYLDDDRQAVLRRAVFETDRGEASWAE